MRALRRGVRVPRRNRDRRSGRAHVRLLRHRLLRVAPRQGFAMKALHLEGQPLASDDRPLLRAMGLSKHFGARVACQDVSLDVHEGEVVAVVGESGSGKSTLLALLSTQLLPSNGSISYRMRDGVTRDLFH